jgi:hypothetical protein
MDGTAERNLADGYASTLSNDSDLQIGKSVVSGYIRPYTQTLEEPSRVERKLPLVVYARVVGRCECVKNNCSVP